tara:strand:+ start:505 stop:846 length:342 start_codon:yes stop_codon:yes gene_type:complete
MNTTITEYLYNQSSVELINLGQSSLSFVITMAIFIKVFNFKNCLKSVRNKNKELKRKREAKELEKMKKLIESVQNHRDINVKDLIDTDDDDDDEKEDDDAVMKIARKKKREIV